MTQSTRAKCAPKLKSADRGRALVEDWRQSGLSQMAFARQRQVGAHLLSYWSKRFPATMDTAAKATTHHARMVEPFVQIPMPPSHGHIEIRLPGGALVRVTPGADPGLLRVVVHALAGMAC